jgi:uncharacterized protein YndB with AHSA1/START domain
VKDQLTSDGGRAVVRMERRLAHPPAKVWAALTEPDRLAEWFPATVRADLRVGGAVEFGFGPAGTVTDLDPPRLIAYTWGDDHLRWEVEPDGEGALLTLTHTFGDRVGAATFASGWHICIAGLDLALAGRPGQDPGIDHPALHEQFVIDLGLDACEVEETADGRRVRFERQLVRSAEEVWPELAGAWEGSVVVAEEPKVLEVQAADGRVRWELGEGTPHGARLTVTWTGTDPAAADAAAARIPALAARLSRPAG